MRRAVTNARRAARALRALTEYEIRADPLAAVTNRLADLRHLCAREGISFERCLDLSEMHFNVECEEERIVASDASASSLAQRQGSTALAREISLRRARHVEHGSRRTTTMAFDSSVKGKRVGLIRCTDEYTDLPSGSLGTAQFIDDMDTLHVKWDNGAMLGLIREAAGRSEFVEGNLRRHHHVGDNSRFRM
jgi:hypothetical protein